MNWLKCSMAAIGVIVLLLPDASNAQTGNAAPSSGTKTWRYECKSGNCPTKCSVGSGDLFSTGSFSVLTINQVSDRTFWIRVESGQKNSEYIIDGGERLICAVSDAVSTSAPVRP